MKTTVTIISASNLIGPSDSPQINAMVRVLGHSAEDYLIGETNFIRNTNSPVFNASFSFDFFRASYIDFCIYNHNSFSTSDLIGMGRIQASEIVPTEIMKIPIRCLRSDSITSDLTVRFSFDYTPIKKGSFGMFKNQIFLYTTYQAISTDTNPVDIDCLIVDHKWKTFYVLNSGNWWTTAGRSSNNETVPVGVGYSQIRKLDLKKLKGCEVHFYIKSNTFNGKLALNFGCMSKEGNGKVKEFFNKLCLFKQIEFDVTQGNVYSSPEKLVAKSLGRIEFTYEDSSEYNSLINYLVNGLKMAQRYILPHNCPTSISDHSNIAFVFGGAAYSEDDYCDIIPKMYIFEKDTSRFIGSLKENNINSGLDQLSIQFEGYNDRYKESSLNGNSKYSDSSSMSVNLERFNRRFMMIIGVKVSRFFMYDVRHPMVRIIDIDTNKELYFMPFKPSVYEAKGELLFSVEYRNDNWVIVPIFYPVMNGSLLKRAALDFVSNGCIPFKGNNLGLDPLIQSKKYELEKNNQIDAY